MRATQTTIQERTGKVTCAGLLSIVAVLSACAPDWPQTGSAPSAEARAAADPSLLTGPEIAAALGPGATAEMIDTATSLAGRAAALRARARALTGPVIPPRDRRRLETAARAAELRMRELN